VVRLLPPLIVGEAEIAEALTRIDRACAALSSAQTKPATTGAVA
jgi:acetylornithine/N-succinyldiaminopimelate aminotransferase